MLLMQDVFDTTIFKTNTKTSLTDSGGNKPD